MAAAAVVIPTRNRRLALERAINSVRSQTFRDWEIVVVDDASEDSTPEFLDGLDDPRIKVEHLNEHAERSVARNRGLALLASPAVLFLDDDDELLPAALEVLTRGLARHVAACAAVGAVLHEVDGIRRRPSFPTRARLLDIRLDVLAGWVALGGQSLMRTQAVRDVGGWREGLSVAEDQELWLRLCSRGPVAVVGEAALIHRPHGLGGDALDFRDAEREVVNDYLEAATAPDDRAVRAARAREHLRDADIGFQRGAYRSTLGATLRGILAAPFLLASPLVGPGLTRGLGNALVAASLPRPVVEALRVAMRKHRIRSSVGAG